MLAILMLQDIPNISFSPLTWRTKNGTSCARLIFEVYILLFCPYLNALNWSLRLNKKKLYTLSIYIYNIYILHGLKSPGIFNENKRFWAKLYLFLNIAAFKGDTWYSDFPTFRCPFCSTKRPSVSFLRNTPRFPRWLPHSIWISFPGATAWGLGTDNSRWGPSLENTVGEQPIRIVIGPIWPSLSRTCVTVRYRDGTERRRK